MKKLLLFILSTLLILGFGTFAQAIPSAGVAPSDGGVYWGPDQDWLDAWTDTALGTGAGFILPGGSGDLTLWYGANNQNSYNKIVPADMYLFSTYGDGTFNGVAGKWEDTNQIDGYKGADGVFDGGYYVWELPNIGTEFGSDAGWTTYDDFKPLPGPDQDLADSTYGGNKLFNFYTGTFEGNLPKDEWIFLVAVLDDGITEIAQLSDGAIGPNGGGTEFIFSPKTTSTAVPEPATMLLLGSGLLGFAGFRKKIFKR